MNEAGTATADAFHRHALPQSCQFPGNELFEIQLRMLPRLKKIMSDADIIAASAEQQPQLDTMRRVTCRRCMKHTCPQNFGNNTPGFSTLLKRRFEKRVEEGKQLLEWIIPTTLRDKLTAEGITVSCDHLPSRKNPHLAFEFSYGGTSRRVSCDIGKKEVYVDYEKQPLTSTTQLKKLVEEAIRQVKPQSALEK